ncbi:MULTISPECIES: CsbD family protein [unclassified Nocardioides]|uniref:CsbD family protein n=1 Tax=unclassified Nocardioides TaxID=2615069 RepID=UPI003619EE95
MGAADKARHAAEKAKGKAKEATGKATNNPTKTGRGQREQTKADLKQAGEKAKDAFKS